MSRSKGTVHNLDVAPELQSAPRREYPLKIQYHRYSPNRKIPQGTPELFTTLDTALPDCKRPGMLYTANRLLTSISFSVTASHEKV